MARVISCEFLRCEVESHSLFQQEYARTNRERGVKLLRCFPHCCPDHVKRSYCGCSVRVLVTFSTDVRLMDLDDILVCSRFEPTRVVPLWPESLANLAQDLGAPGSDDTQENRRLDIGESVTNLPWQNERSSDGWVRGERVNHQHLPTNKALYMLNGGKSPKWFYHYDSSITRTQREMTHHLVAYTFRLQDNQSTTVVARHASPAFVLMSYRRSHGAGGSGRALPAMEKPQNNMEQQKPPYVTKKPSDAVHQRKSQSVGTCEAQEDSSLWQLDAEHYYPGFREKGLHILILVEFLQYLTLEDIHVDTRLIRNHWFHVFSALQSPLSAQSDGIIGSFLGEIFRDTEHEEASTAPAIQMTMYLLIQALSSSTVRHLIRSALEVDYKELHDSFAWLISSSYDFLNGLVQNTSNVAISTLVDDVLSIVYSEERFNALRGQLSNLLLGQQAPGPLSNALNRTFCAFKTLMLQCDQQPLSRASLTHKTPLQSAWSRRWLLEPGSLKLNDGVRDIIPTLHVIDVAQFIRECGCVDLQLESDMSCLIVRSAFSILGESSIELVLDQKLRPVSKLPSGLIEWNFSDYAASFSDGEHLLEIDLFTFSASHNNTGVILRRFRLSMSLEHQLSFQVLSRSVSPTSLFVLVQGDISKAIYQPKRFGGEFSKLPIQERAAMYESLEWIPLMEMQAGYVAIPDRFHR